MTIEITLPSVNLTFEFTELLKYRDELRLQPGGVYAFYGIAGECLYVGKSKTLYDRLSSHRYSPFIDEIETVDIRFVENPVFRDIYETFAITELGAIYNRDKLDKQTPHSYVRPILSGNYRSLIAVETLIGDTETQITDIEEALKPPERGRYHNNFNDDETELSQSFYEYMAALEEFTARDNGDLEDELRYLTAFLDELKTEEAEIKQSITDSLSELVV